MSDHLTPPIPTPAAAPAATTTAADDNKLIAERREKLKLLRNAQAEGKGVAFPNDFKPGHRAAALTEAHGATEAEALEAQAVAVSVAGRMMLKRVMGKASFATLQDATSRIQLYVTRDAVGEDAYAEFKRWDLGDILGAEGTLMKTKTGELSIKVTKLRLLTKSLRPLPGDFYGMADQEQKYRQRYVDLITDESARVRFTARSKAVSALREFMVANGFLEVETPMLHPIPGGANAKPFKTHHNALDQEMFLRIAPELYLKRLIVGGFERVFEINRSYRNEGISVRHNPEFTMMEFYAAYWNYRDLMDFTETLIRTIADKAVGSQQLTYGGKPVDLTQPFERLTIREAILKHTDAGDGVDDTAWLIAALRKLGLSEEKDKLAAQPREPAGDVLRGNRRREALAADFHHGTPDRDLAAGAYQRQASGHRALQALHHRARIRQRLQRAERRRGPGRALQRAGRRQGQRRRRSHVLRPRLRARARIRHAAHRRLRHRHRPSDDAADGLAEHPRRDPVPGTAQES